MASVTVTARTVTLAGTSITPKTGVGDGQTATLCSDTELDFERTFVRVYNTGSANAVTLSLGVGTQYSGKGIGAKSISLASSTTIIIGGDDFEGARFLTSSGTVVFTQTGTGPTSWEAYAPPKATE